MLSGRFDPLFQTLSINTVTMGTVVITDINEVLKLILLFLSIGFTIFRWWELKNKNNKKLKK